MIKNILTILFLFIGIIALAQVDFSIKVGLNSTNQIVKEPSVVNYDQRFSGIFGVAANVNIKKNVSLGIDFHYTSNGAEFSRNGSFLDRRFQYLELPVVIKYHFLNKFNFHIGTQLGYLLRTDLLFDNPGSDPIYYETTDENYRFTLSFIGGLEYNPLKKVGVGVRYLTGISDLTKDSSTKLFLKSTYHFYLKYQIK